MINNLYDTIINTIDTITNHYHISNKSKNNFELMVNQ